MSSADPELIYREFHGSLTPAADPSDAGSQHVTYGYSLVNNPDLQPIERFRLFVANQLGEATTTQPASSRPIAVNIRTPDKVGPGVVSEPIAVQALRQAIDPSEWENAAVETAPQDERNRASQMLWVSIAAGSNDAEIAITDELQSQILDLFSGSRYATTRSNLIAALARDGSRSEEMFGFNIAYPQDFQRAEAWRQANEPGLPPLIGEGA